MAHKMNMESRTGRDNQREFSQFCSFIQADLTFAKALAFKVNDLSQASFLFLPIKPKFS
jgi:hypothetical protein